MSRLNKLEDLLFPVAAQPVFVEVAGEGERRRLPVPDKKAIVNRHTDRVLGIVSRSYRLVSNQEAIDMAYRCCGTVFPETQPGEWQVSTVDAPATGSYCTLDLVHNSTALDFNGVPPDQRPEVFGPFIRVTNSFNGLRALGFDVGFYRKICRNGLIIPDTIIRFSFTHQRCDLGAAVQFDVAKDKLARFRGVFTDSLAGLRACMVPLPQFQPLIRGVLALRPPEPLWPDTREAADWEKLTNHLDTLSQRYAGELGTNAYAVFNALTDFASHPSVNRCVHRDRHSLQRRAGSWLAAFNQNCRKPGFTIAGHLEEWLQDQTKTRNQRN